MLTAKRLLFCFLFWSQCVKMYLKPTGIKYTANNPTLHKYTCLQIHSLWSFAGPWKYSMTKKCLKKDIFQNLTRRTYPWRAICQVIRLVNIYVCNHPKLLIKMMPWVKSAINLTDFPWSWWLVATWLLPGGEYPPTAKYACQSGSSIDCYMVQTWCP